MKVLEMNDATRKRKSFIRKSLKELMRSPGAW